MGYLYHTSRYFPTFFINVSIIRYVQYRKGSSVDFLYILPNGVSGTDTKFLPQMLSKMDIYKIMFWMTFKSKVTNRFLVITFLSIVTFLKVINIVNGVVNI